MLLNLAALLPLRSMDQMKFKKQNCLTMADLHLFVRSQSIRDKHNYDLNSWQKESNQIRRQRYAVYNSFPIRWQTKSELLVKGVYGNRLTIAENVIDFIPCQYSATEIWDYVLIYLRQTDNLIHLNRYS